MGICVSVVRGQHCPEIKKNKRSEMRISRNFFGFF